MKNSSIDQITVGLFWQTRTSDNLGVCALAESNIAIIQSAAERSNIRVKFIEFCPQGTKTSNTTEIIEISIAPQMSIKNILLGKTDYYEYLKKCDLILDVGQGDSFSDIYGTKRYMYLAFSKLLAIFAGIPLILSPQTIGPFALKGSAIISKWILKRARKVFARDGMSYALLTEYGLKENCSLVTDMAFRLPYKFQISESNGKIKLGLNVSGLLYNGGYTGRNQFGLCIDYPHLVEEILKRWTSNSIYEVHLIPHVISDSFHLEDDFRISKELQNRYPQTILAPRFENASEAKGYISKMDFFTGARMHSCIAAFSSGVPTIPLAYSRKFNGLFESLGYGHIADLKTDNLNVILSKMDQGINNIPALKMEIESGNRLALELLKTYEDYLFDIIGEINGLAN